MRRQIQGAVLAFLVLGVIAGGGYFIRYYTSTIIPRAEEYRRTLIGLQPSQVQRVYLSTGSTASGSFVATRRRQLEESETAALPPLLDRATKWVPNYAHGGWQCLLEIETSTRVPRFQFEIFVTENNGVMLNLHSKARGGWNYGTLRDDALRPWLEACAAKMAADSSPAGNPVEAHR